MNIINKTITAAALAWLALFAFAGTLEASRVEGERVVWCDGGMTRYGLGTTQVQICTNKVSCKTYDIIQQQTTDQYTGGMPTVSIRSYELSPSKLLQFSFEFRKPVKVEVLNGTERSLCKVDTK